MHQIKSFECIKNIKSYTNGVYLEYFLKAYTNGVYLEYFFKASTNGVYLEYFSLIILANSWTLCVSKPSKGVIFTRFCLYKLILAHIWPELRIRIQEAKYQPKTDPDLDPDPFRMDPGSRSESTSKLNGSSALHDILTLIYNCR